MISLHFTLPQDEVVPSGSFPGEVLDIETLESEDLSYDLNLKVA